MEYSGVEESLVRFMFVRALQAYAAKNAKIRVCFKVCLHGLLVVTHSRPEIGLKSLEFLLT